VTFAIAIGEWKESGESQRTCFGLDAHERARDVVFEFINPDQSPWAQTELLGPMLSREEALRCPEHNEVLTMAETIIENHPAVRRFLHFRNGAEGRQIIEHA
jgi:hypothetical protein